jgi:broad specificity phosphatase PhoE
MIIRHAEKHQHGLHGQGVNENGQPSRHELTVRGWQRAGALVQYFTQPGPTGHAIETPHAIFASDAAKNSPSLRAMHTAASLAEALGLAVNHDFADGEEEALANAVLAAPSPVLIVWHHGSISKLARVIAGEQIGCPRHWPEDRFDVVWILERGGPHQAWTFRQVAQCLLPGDCPDVF